MKPKTPYFILIAALIFILDRVTKFIALQGVHERNYGLIFGLLDSPELRWPFVLLMFAVLLFFIYALVLKEVKREWELQLGILLMIAGLVGNLLDRILYGYIIDFIRIADITSFNISDVSITLGAFFLVFYLLKR